MSANGSARLDRIEVAIEKLTERMDASAERFSQMVEHHDREFKDFLRSQVLMQGQIEDLRRSQDAGFADLRRSEAAAFKRLTEAQAVQGERLDKLVVAIGELVRRLPVPSAEASRE